MSSHSRKKKRDLVRYTFPIPPRKLGARKWKLALQSPISWAPFLPVAGAFTFLDAGALITGGLALLVGGGVFAYWKSHHRKLETKLLNDLIRESNEEQDAQLVKDARHLLKQGYPDYAATLGTFLERKKQIEAAIHEDGSAVTPEKKEIENLIDAVVFGVSDQLERLAEFDDRLTGKKSSIPLSKEQQERIEKARKEISLRIHEAYEIVEDTWDNLGSMLNPAAHLDPHDTTHLSLDNAVKRLREERDIAQRVQKRMEKDWGARFGEAPKSPDSEEESLSD